MKRWLSKYFYMQDFFLVLVIIISTEINRPYNLIIHLINKIRGVLPSFTAFFFVNNRQKSSVTFVENLSSEFLFLSQDLISQQHQTVQHLKLLISLLSPNFYLNKLNQDLRQICLHFSLLHKVNYNFSNQISFDSIHQVLFNKPSVFYKSNGYFPSKF
jgi:hypothetical protein